jgi:hypothetical protein
MKKNSIELGNKIKPASKTNWDKVINQTNSEVLRNANADPESPILSNRKYYKPKRLES